MNKARVGFALAVPAIAALGAALACVLADPPPVDPLPPPSRPTILSDIVTPRLDQKLTSQPVAFDIPVAVDPSQSIKWRVFQDLDPAVNTQFVGGLDVTDDGGVTLPDTGNAVRVIDDPFNGLDFGSQCHTFTFVVAVDFDPTIFARPADIVGSNGDVVCASCGDQVTWFWQPVADCNFDDAAPPTYLPEASDGASD